MWCFTTGKNVSFAGNCIFGTFSNISNGKNIAIRWVDVALEALQTDHLNRKTNVMLHSYVYAILNTTVAMFVVVCYAGAV